MTPSASPLCRRSVGRTVTNQEVYARSHCVSYCAMLSWMWLYCRRIQWQPHHNPTTHTCSFFLLLFKRHVNKTARSCSLVSEFRSTASMVSLALPMLTTLRAGWPTGASVLSRCKKTNLFNVQLYCDIDVITSLVLAYRLLFMLPAARGTVRVWRHFLSHRPPTPARP